MNTQNRLMGILIIFLLSGFKSPNEVYLEGVQLFPPSQIDTIWFEYEKITGIGYGKGVSRRDPSDIIKVENIYYVWYTYIPAETNGKKTPLYNSGYYGTIWYATSADGYNWVEKGEALGKGEQGSFDSHAVFTPNILKFEGKFYMYYTGVKPTPGNQKNSFDNNSENDVTAIGLAVSDNPEGPFVRINKEPVLKISDEESDFDSYRIDDAALIIKNQEVWLFYKGRSKIHGKSGPGKTQMGVAFADRPEGLFKKYHSPLLENSHEVLIWNQEGGIASLASINRTINFAHDGLNFKILYENLENIPIAPGFYRPHLSEPNEMELPGWGISHKIKDGDVYLIRFKLNSE